MSQGALGSDDLACFVSEESSRQEPRRTEMAFTNLRPAVAGAPAADDEQHYLLVWRWIFDSNKNSSCIREPFKNYLADFFSVKLSFFEHNDFPLRGGEYPPIPLKKKSAKKQLFLAKKRLF